MPMPEPSNEQLLAVLLTYSLINLSPLCCLLDVDLKLGLGYSTSLKNISKGSRTWTFKAENVFCDPKPGLSGGRKT